MYSFSKILCPFGLYFVCNKNRTVYLLATFLTRIYLWCHNGKYELILQKQFLLQYFSLLRYKLFIFFLVDKN